MANATAYTQLPPLPAYNLRPVEPLINGIPDAYTMMALPFIAYWGVSLFFHLLDEFDFFPQYRLHTPAEVLKRNHVTRWDVFKDVLIQQVVQTIVGLILGMAEGPNMTGRQEYDIAWYAQKIRMAETWLPNALQIIGIDSTQLAKNLSTTKLAMFSGALAGGAYPELTQSILAHGQQIEVPAFAQWELLAGKAIYHVGIPFLQFFFAILFVDTWQYFLHRAMHMNKWLYTTFHARHHKLYVPYAYGALYNHPVEGFLLDTLGTGLASLVMGMTVRQNMWFFTMSTIKTVDDHCGYAFPWDPLQHLTNNNAGYHDVHHQSWGIKTNFSQPFFTFWDTVLGTKWVGGDVSARYEKAKIAAQAKVDADNATITKSSSTKSSPNPYARDAANATSIARNAVQPRLLRGKAAQQAAASRQQVLDTDGVRPMLREAMEENHAKTAPVLVRT